MRQKPINLLKSIVILFFLSCCISGNVYARHFLSKTYQIKAGFLLHFTSFVEWPDVNHPNLNICIVGHDPFGSYLDDMVITRPTNRSGKKINIFRIPVGENIGKCNLIFTTKDDTNQQYWESIPEKHSILLISDFEEFTSKGGLIRFYEENKRIRIEINILEVSKANLIISSELLKLSRIIQYNNSEQKK